MSICPIKKEKSETFCLEDKYIVTLIDFLGKDEDDMGYPASVVDGVKRRMRVGNQVYQSLGFGHH